MGKKKKSNFHSNSLPLSERFKRSSKEKFKPEPSLVESNLALAPDASAPSGDDVPEDISLREQLDKIEKAVENLQKKPSYGETALKAFMEFIKLGAFCSLVFYALSFDVSQRAASKALEYLSFGSGARANFALHLLASQTDSDQVSMAISLVNERVDAKLSRFFTLPESEVLSLESYMLLKELDSYRFSSDEFKVYQRIQKEGEALKQSELARFEKQFAFSKEKRALDLNETKDLTEIANALQEKRYFAALEKIHSMTAVRLKPLEHAKRTAFYGAFVADKEKLKNFIESKTL